MAWKTRSLAYSIGCLTVGLGLSLPAAKAQQAVETPASMVEALHAAFGTHHARAVHTKGLVFIGKFTPSPDAQAIVKTPIFLGGESSAIVRFSLFAGLPDLPDNDDGASPTGMGIKIKAADGDDFDLEVNQHRDFITATFDEFAVLLRAIGEAGKGDTAPLEKFLADHPHAREFLASRTYPASYAEAKYFGVNAVKLTNTAGAAVYARYQLIPRAREHYLTTDERKVKSATYLHDEVLERVKHTPIVFDWYAQIAEPSDVVTDPSIAWPDTRRLVKLGTVTITGQPPDPLAVDKSLLLLPGQPHDGVEPADPMLVLRNEAYPISFGERQ